VGTKDLAKVIADAIAPISPLLFRGTANALTNAERRIGDLVANGAFHLRALTVREELRAMLSDQDLMGWVVEGNPAKMGELYLRHPAAGLLLRVLKERRSTYPGGVPVAGANQARRTYWAQPYQPMLPIPGMAPAKTLGLHLLWDLVNGKDIEEGFTLRVVHTTEPGTYGSRVPIDLSVELDATMDPWTNLQFRGDDQIEDFFPDEETRAGQLGGV
jgi:hypothetical protein